MTITDPSLPSILSPGRVQPVQPEERLLTLDVLRGIALLGVLVANAWAWFSGLFFHLSDFRPELVRATLNSAVFHFVFIFVNGKAIAVFSFLFGVGFAVQARYAEVRGASVAPLYARRMVVLAAIGLTHALLWYGDILAVYALLGCALLLFQRRGDRTLLAWAAILLAVVPLAFGAYSVVARPAAPPASQAAYGAAMLAAIRSGNAAQIVPANVEMLVETWLSRVGLLLFAQLLGLFLLGLWAGRRRILEQVPASRAAFRRVAVWGVAAAIPASVALEIVRTVPGLRAAAATPWPSFGLTTLRILSVVPLAAAYVCVVVLLMENARWRARLAAFASVGRMALTNYLAQTVICILVFYGGGLVGRIGPAGAVGIALVVFAAQLAWSPWWLARFRFGPAEWLWRSLTYGRRQPMRLHAPTAHTVGGEPRAPGAVTLAESRT